jgi:hypothetical protein
MISNYFEISSEADFAHTLDKCTQLIKAAEGFGVKRIRTFAGQCSSEELLVAQRIQAVERLRKLDDLCETSGIHLLLETRPHTLTDSIDATLLLLHELDHRNVKINLDFLHVWESGTDLIDEFECLKPWVEHFHLKNVTSARDLGVFHPHNVYSASGSRSGMAAPHPRGGRKLFNLLTRFQLISWEHVGIISQGMPTSRGDVIDPPAGTDKPAVIVFLKDIIDSTAACELPQPFG